MNVRAAFIALLAAWFLGSLSAQTADAADLADIVNYRAYSDTLSSSGQPKKSQFGLLKEDGFERVVFLAYSDHHESIANEDRIVENLGMEFVQIPINWDAPAKSDFYMFAGVMNSGPQLKTLVHCQVNFRASAFSFLYRVLFEEIPMDQAKDDMETVWVPNATWRNFIFSILEENGRSPHCDGCLWNED